MEERIGKVTLDLKHYPGEDLYCDGAVEDELLSIVRDHAEVEYPRIIEERASWPILYHLSSLRENTVEWIPMKKDARVLEVGSGCGAITGALARKAGEVVCVDLSKKRSQINAYRHSECENVRIHVGNFRDVEPDLPTDFDFIFLIGVFEYGQSYMGKEKPFEEFLSIIKKHLAPGGRIVIAIENKYGLKYFAGCKEDHLGTWFSGIENYADGGGVRTFSRKGLEKIFAACGMEQYSFYYPYPDYKFMTTLYSDDYLPGRGELYNNIRNFDRDRMLLFDERRAFDGIVEDGLFSVFANSYEVILGEGFDTKYVKYSNDRAPEYRIRTEIIRSGKEMPEVRKHPLQKEAEEHVRGMASAYEKLSDRYVGGELAINTCTLHEDNGEVYASFPFVKGKSLTELLDDCLQRDDMEGFLSLFRKYMERVGFGEETEAADFDPVFSNLLVDGDDWTLIDYEWTFGKQIETRELAFRAIYCYLLEDEKRNKLNLDLLLRELAVTEEEAEDYREQEQRFQKFVTGQQRSLSELWELLGKRLLTPVKWVERIEENKEFARVQIYEDRGNGFSEEESYFVSEAYQGEQDVELNLSVDGNVRTLRIDPAMGTCVVRVEEMTFNGESVPLQDKKIFYANGKLLWHAPAVVFSTEDPNLYIHVEALGRQGENVLYAKMKVIKLPTAIAEDMAAAVKRLI